MSIKLKFPFIILAAFVINILILGGYYELFMSKQFTENTNVQQVELNAAAARIVSGLAGETDIISYLTVSAREKDLEISLEPLNGDSIFSTSGYDIAIAGFYSGNLVEHDGVTYLLKVKKNVGFGNLTSISIMRDLLNAEILFVFVILVLLSVSLYFNFTRNVLALKKDMEKYEIGVSPSLTTRKDELGQVKNSFVHLTNALESEKQKQNRIIASISHDVKTPLTSVMAYTERLIKGNMDTQRQQKYLNTIYSKAQDIQDIIEDFDEYLGFTMQSSLKKQTCTAQQICDLVREDYAEELRTKGVDLIVHSSCSDALIHADIAKLRRVFANLIANSVKYAAKEHLTIDIACHKKENKVLFSVRDNGNGIDESALEQIFEPFYTTDQGRSVSGLGLSICKNIIATHGGDLWAEPNDSGGLTISFFLHSTE